MWCPYIKRRLGKPLGGEVEGKQVDEGESGGWKDQMPGEGGSFGVKRMVRRSTAVWISVLGLAVLVLGYWLFYYGARLRYLPKYRAIVLVSGANHTVVEIGAWLTVVGVCALGTGGVVEIVRKLLGKDREMYFRAAVGVCLVYFFYMVMLALFFLTRETPWPWFFIGAPVAVYFVLVYDGISCLRRVWISRCRCSVG